MFLIFYVESKFSGQSVDKIVFPVYWGMETYCLYYSYKESKSEILAF
jgi:hypothetical protein